MARLRLDPTGRLLDFAAIPLLFDDSTGPWPDPDWLRLFTEADLDPESFNEVPPVWAPRMASDVQIAWEGAREERPDLKLRVEAAGYRGKLVSFTVYAPWIEAPKLEAADMTVSRWLTNNLGLAVMSIGSLLIGAIFAWKNVRAGRSDTRGGFRLAFWFFVFHTVVWALWASHVFDLNREWSIIRADVGYNLFLAANLWLVYVGLEPYVRKHWPDSIITWSRVLRGKFRDPRLGRDILVGAAAGGLFGLLARADEWIESIATGIQMRPRGVGVNDLGSVTAALGFTLDKPIHSLLQVMQGLFVLLILRIVLKKIWIAGIAFVILIGLTNGALGAENAVLVWSIVTLMVALVLFVMVRFGLVAGTVAFTMSDLLNAMGLPGNVTAWYAPSFLIPCLVVLGLLVYGFHISLAGQPMFGSGQLADD
jgi:serine/threonine-protein kinase